MLRILDEFVVLLLDGCSSLRNGVSLNLRVHIVLEIMVRNCFGELLNYISSFVVV